MSSEKGPEVEKEVMNSIASDSISLFRTGLFLIVAYATILSLALQEGEAEIITNTINSTYTFTGFLIWIGSLVAAIWSYRTARYISLLDEYPQLNRISDQKIVLNKVSAVAIGFLISVVSLLFGLIEGWIRTYSNTPGGISMEAPVVIAGFGFLLLMGLFGVLSTIDYVRERMGAIRELLKLS